MIVNLLSKSVPAPPVNRPVACSGLQANPFTFNLIIPLTAKSVHGKDVP